MKQTPRTKRSSETTIAERKLENLSLRATDESFGDPNPATAFTVWGAPMTGLDSSICSVPVEDWLN